MDGNSADGMSFRGAVHLGYRTSAGGCMEGLV
jgi:hypothetical protein